MHKPGLMRSTSIFILPAPAQSPSHGTVNYPQAGEEAPEKTSSVLGTEDHFLPKTLKVGPGTVPAADFPWVSGTELDRAHQGSFQDMSVSASALLQWLDRGLCVQNRVPHTLQAYFPNAARGPGGF